MPERRVGLWLIGALGGVGSTVALGLAAARNGVPGALTTELPQFAKVPFPSLDAFVVGGHDLRAGTFLQASEELRRRSGVFSEALLRDCSAQLDKWSANIRPGVLVRQDAAIHALVNRGDIPHYATPRNAIAAITRDLHDFQAREQLDCLIVVNVASTEPPFAIDQETLSSWQCQLDDTEANLPESSLYAHAALDAGCPYINCTPSAGASFPALEKLARLRQVPHFGRDLKTGETLLKSVLAPLFAKRNLRVLSWVGHNILGNRDGQILDSPNHKASKIHTKDGLLQNILGYKPQTHVSIEYVESLDDWKTAWDHIHFEGFLGTKMTLQFTWQGCDSLLAAPLVIDLARIAVVATENGVSGVYSPAGCFFKEPLGMKEQDFGVQFAMLEQELLKYTVDS